MDREKINEFIKKNNLCLLATASKEGKPQAAVMAYIFKDELLYIFTETNTRKYKNILENNQISVVVGGLKNDPTVQIDGTIVELSSEEGAKVKEFALGLYSEWKGYFDSLDGRWFAIKPFWMRYGNFSSDPPEIFEVTI